MFNNKALILLTLVTSTLAFYSQTPFQLGDITAEPGMITNGYVIVPDTEYDKGTDIPVSIAHGTEPGQVLLLIAGIHGSEYSPIIALQRLLSLLDPEYMSGTVIIVHIANPPAFYGRTIYISPQDGKNLNRLFPGDKYGTISDRIAHILSDMIIPRADAVIDLHCGDANEDLTPWTGYYVNVGHEDVIDRSKQLADAFGIRCIVQFPFKLEAGHKMTYTGPTAVIKGIPAFDAEVGRLGLVEDDLINTILHGLKNVMRRLGIIPGKSLPVINPWYITKRDYYKSEHNGFFYSSVKAGDQVQAGDKIGYITGHFANTLQEVFADNSGKVLIVVGCPAINVGETVAVIAVDTDF